MPKSQVLPDKLRTENGHPPVIRKNKKTRAKIERYAYQKELISLVNRNESAIIDDILNKPDVEMKNELKKCKIPRNPAKKLVQVMRKNRLKMNNINNM